MNAILIKYLVINLSHTTLIILFNLCEMIKVSYII